jgi:hypothetical protein
MRNLQVPTIFGVAIVVTLAFYLAFKGFQLF